VVDLWVFSYPLKRRRGTFYTVNSEVVSRCRDAFALLHLYDALASVQVYYSQYDFCLNAYIRLCECVRWLVKIIFRARSWWREVLVINSLRRCHCQSLLTMVNKNRHQTRHNYTVSRVRRKGTTELHRIPLSKLIPWYCYKNTVDRLNIAIYGIIHLIEHTLQHVQYRVAKLKEFSPKLQKSWKKTFWKKFIYYNGSQKT